MDFLSLKFAAFIIATLIAYHAVGSRLKRFVVLPLANALFIASFAPTPRHLLPFALFLLTGYALVRAVQASPARRNGILSVGILLLLFVYLKKYAFLSVFPPLPWPYLAVGLSYVLFRIIHVLVDAREGSVGGKVSFVSFVNYTCSFLTFVSGPLQRYQDYVRQEREAGSKELSQGMVFAGFSRAADGLLKIGAMSALFSWGQQRMAALLSGYIPPAELAVLYAGACLCYAVYLYFNFSGYMDVVIGIGGLFGFSLPENFNKPFSSTSFLEFWTRWHITLSEWFKFYVFNPLMKTLTYRWGSPKSAPYLGVVAFFVVFLLMGIWHGSTYSFLLYGLFLGAGVSVNKLYEVEMRKRFGKAFYNDLGRAPLYRALGGALTLSYWSLALTCFWMDFGKITGIIARMGIPGVLGAFVSGIAGSLAAMALYAAGRWVWVRVRGRVSVPGNHFYLQQGFLAAKVTVILFLIKLNTAPEFVYKAF